MNIKSLFVKDEGEDAKPKGLPPKKPVQTIVTTPVENITTSTDYGKDLLDRLEKANLPGPDYLEFSKALTKLESRGTSMTDQEKYENTYMAFESMGCTSDILVSSAGKYLEVMDTTKDRFEEEMRTATVTLISNKQSTVANEKQAIQQLEEQIKTKRNLIEKLTKEMDDDNLRLSNEKNAFNFAFERTKNLINEHISKIKTYLHANVTK